MGAIDALISGGTATAQPTTRSSGGSAIDALLSSAPVQQKVANPNVPIATQTWNGQQIPANINTQRLVAYDQATGNRTFKLTTPAGQGQGRTDNGVYTQDAQGNIVKGGHTTYGGITPQQGQQRDDIIPAGLGGTNSNPGNIRMVPLGIANQQDKIETNLSKQVKSGQVQPKAAITQALSQKDQIANPSGAKDFISHIGVGFHNTGFKEAVTSAPPVAMVKSFTNPSQQEQQVEKITTAGQPSPVKFIVKGLTRLAEPMVEGLGTQVANIKASNEQSVALANSKPNTIGRQAQPSTTAVPNTKSLNANDILETTLNSANVALPIAGIVTDFLGMAGDKIATRGTTLKVTPEQISEVLKSDTPMPPQAQAILTKLAENGQGFEMQLKRPAGGTRQTIGEALGGTPEIATTFKPTGEVNPQISNPETYANNHVAQSYLQAPTTEAPQYANDLVAQGFKQPVSNIDTLVKTAESPVITKIPEIKTAEIQSTEPKATDFITKKEMARIVDESKRFENSQMEANYKKFVQKYNQQFGRNFEDAQQFKDKVPGTGDLLYSQDHSDSEVFDMFKDRMQAQAGFASPSAIAESVKGKINSAKDLIAQTKTGLTASSNLEDSLFQIKQAAKADKLQAAEMIKNSPMTNKDAEAIYHYQENKSETLTPKQQELYQSEIKPLADESAKIVAKLKPLIPLNEDTYTPRFVKGKGGVIDRMIAKGKASFGSQLSKSAPSLQKRTMKVLIDDSGNRTVVSIKDGRVTGFNNKKAIDLGGTKSVANKNLDDNTQFVDKNGKTYNIEQATTKEIEQHTNLTYHHNALVNHTITYLKLKQVERAVDFLEAYKETPEFKTIAVEFGKGLAPDGWRPSALRTFSGYVFEPHVAAVLDDFNKSLISGADPLKILTGVNSFLRTSIFFNPLIHVPNIANHWFVARGLTSFANPKAYPTLVKTSVRAINAVMKQNSDYVEMLKAGANLLYADENVKNLNDLLLQKMSQNIETDPQLKFFRETFPNFIKWLNPYKISGKITWAVNDIATMQAIYEDMATGKTMQEAIADVGKHIPNYRVPANVFGSEAVAKFLKNPNITMFSAYHYGALKSYAETAKDVFKGSLGEKAKAFDRLAMLALITLVLYPQLDKLAKKVTGNSKAQFRRAGASTLVDRSIQLAEGKIDVGSFITTFLTPAPGSKETLQQVFNTDLFTGEKIRTPGQSGTEQLKESATHAGLQVSPAQQYQRIASGSISSKDYVSSLFGISSPKSTPTEKIVQSMVYDEKPKLQAKLKPLVASGKNDEAQKLVNDFNNRLKQATIQAFKDNNQPVPDDLDKVLKAQYIKLPGEKAMQNYNSNKGKTPLQKVLK